MKKLTVLVFLSIISQAVFAQVTWKKIESDSLKISFEYPSSWSYEEDAEGITVEGLLLGDDNNPAGLMYMYNPLGIEMTNTYDNLEILYKSFIESEDAKELVIIDTLQRIKLGGREAIAFGIEQKADDGSLIYATFYMLLYNKGLCMVFFGDDKKQYTASYDKYFKPMLASFKFTE